MVQRWKPTRYLKDPRLPKGFLVIEWLHGRWVPLAFNHKDGRQEEGLEVLKEHGLRLREPFHPVPVLESCHSCL